MKSEKRTAYEEIPLALLIIAVGVFGVWSRWQAGEWFLVCLAGLTALFGCLMLAASIYYIRHGDKVDKVLEGLVMPKSSRE